MFVSKNGAWGAHEKFTQIIHASVLAADGEFDFVAGYQAVLPFNIAQGDLFDLASLPYLTLDGKWWSEKGMDALKINGRCYMAGGDIAVTMLEDIYCMFSTSASPKIIIPTIFTSLSAAAAGRMRSCFR